FSAFNKENACAITAQNFAASRPIVCKSLTKIQKMKSRTSRFFRSNRTVLIAASVCLITIFTCVILVAAHKDDGALAGSAVVATPNADCSVKAKALERFGRLPLSFERNEGQTDQSVKFLSRGPGYDLFLTGTDAILSLQANSESETNVREGTVLRLKMLGAA